MDGLRQLVGRPRNVVAHSLGVLGFPGEEVIPTDRYQTERVRRNHW